MSYPPDGPRTEEEEVESPLINGNNDDHAKRDDEEVQIDEVRRYEDFSTVGKCLLIMYDWVQDALRERNARAGGSANQNIITARLDKADGVVGYMWRLLRHVVEEGQTWVVISLVGIAIGVSAALISIITVWLSDMKMGYCSTGWWLSQKFCCLEIAEDGDGCSEWRNWGGVEPFRYIAYILFAAMFSSAAAFVVKCFAPYAAGSGISEIKCIIGGFIIKGFLGAETFFIKGLTLPLAIASGLSVGKEGPSVHVACAIGNVIARLFGRFSRSQLKMRDIVTASSAAGVAVAFGSPIGGVLFSIEEMNQTFSNRTMWQSFVCAFVATFTLASMDPFRTGKLVLFQVSYDRTWHYFEIPFFMVIGLFGALYGAFVIKFNLQMAAFRRKHLANRGVTEAVTLSVITAFVCYLNRFLRIDMTESMEILFRECEGGGDHNGLCQTSTQWRMVNSLLLAVIVRTALIVVSYGCKVPCGIFVPSMAVGAMFGRMVGILVKAMYTAFPTAPWFAVCAPDAPCITPGTYAFLGAAAALGGVTRLTVTVVVIMFELTGALTYVLPVMITLMVTKAVSDQFGGQGIADRMIRFNGFPFLEKEDKEDGDAFVEPIANVMRKDLVLMHASGMPLQTIGEIVQSTSYQGFPVVRSDADRTIIGFVRKTELRYAFDRARKTRNISVNATCTFQSMSAEPDKANALLAKPDIVIPQPQPRRQNSQSRPPNFRADSAPRGSGVEAEQVDFGQYVDEIPLTVSPKMPLEIVMQLFRRIGPRVILVSHEGQLVGLVTVKDVLKHEAHHEAAAHHRKARAAAKSSRPGSATGNGSGRASPLPEHLRTHRSMESTGSSNGWAESWAAVEEGETAGNGLEIVLEEALGWTKVRAEWLKAWFSAYLRGEQAGSRGRGRGYDEAREFELAEDRPG